MMLCHRVPAKLRWQFSAGNPVKLNFDTTKLYVFKQDGSLLASPYQEV